MLKNLSFHFFSKKEKFIITKYVLDARDATIDRGGWHVSIWIKLLHVSSCVHKQIQILSTLQISVRCTA
jgi:hypothetical protein